MPKKTMAVDEEVHGWIKSVATKSGLDISEVMRYLVEKNRDMEVTDFNRIRLRRDMEKIAKRRQQLVAEEKKLERQLKTLGETSN